MKLNTLFFIMAIIATLCISEEIRAEVISSQSISLDSEQNIKQLVGQIKALALMEKPLPQNFIIRIKDYENQNRIEFGQHVSPAARLGRINSNINFQQKVKELVNDMASDISLRGRVGALPTTSTSTNDQDLNTLLQILDLHAPGGLVHLKINSEGNLNTVIDVVEKIIRHPHTAYMQINHPLQLDDLTLNSISSDCLGATGAQDLLTKNLSNSDYPFRNIGFTYNSSNFTQVFSFSGMTNPSDSILVAVIDSGIALDHFQFAHDVLLKNKAETESNGVDDDQNGFIDDIYGGNIDSSEVAGKTTYSKNGSVTDTSSNSHGTHVAGIIATGIYMGRSRDDFAKDGAQKLRILPIRFTDGTNPDEYMAIIGIDYAIARKVRVINASWGKFTDGSSLDVAIKEAVARAAASDIVFVTSAGNNKTDIDSKNYTPASLQNYLTPQVIAVANIDTSKKISSNSNFGPLTVGIAAPGNNVCSSINASKGFGATNLLSGTSMSAPMVAMAAGMIRANRAAYTSVEVKKLIETTGSDKLAGVLISYVKDGSTLSVDGGLKEIQKIIDEANKAPPADPPPLPVNPLTNSTEVVTDSRFVGPSCKYVAVQMKSGGLKLLKIKIQDFILLLSGLVFFWFILKGLSSSTGLLRFAKVNLNILRSISARIK